jgi:hypothetical protein
VTVDDVLRTAADDLLADVRSTIDAESAHDRVVEHRPPRSVRGLSLAAALVVVLGVAAAVLVVTTDDGGEPVISGPTTGSSAPTTTAPAGPAPGEYEGLPVTVTPDDGLADGDTVHVTIDQLPLDEGGVELMMCTGDAMRLAPRTDDCAPIAPYETHPAVDGRLEVDLAVEQVVHVVEGEPVDCARDAVSCSIGITFDRTDHPELIGVAGVGFAPLEPLDEPVLTVTPADGLEHGQGVTIVGEGYVDPVEQATICAPPPGDVTRCWSVPLGDSLGGIAPDDQGRFSVEATVWRAFPVLVDVTGVARWEIVDCAEVGCSLTVDTDLQSAPPVALDFATDTPTPEPPTVEVSPTTGLRPGDPLTITIRGLAVGEETELFACALGGGLVAGDCGPAGSIEPVVGEEDGEVTVTVPAPDPGEYGAGADCTQPDACAVSAALMPARANPLNRVIRPVPVQYAP